MERIYADEFLRRTFNDFKETYELYDERGRFLARVVPVKDSKDRELPESNDINKKQD